MKRSIWILGLSAFLLSGCSKGLIEQLAQDPASACGYSTITYAAGALVFPSPAVPVGGVYVHQHFCRSNERGSIVSLKPDGTIEVQHGVKRSVDNKPAETMAPQPKPTQP